MGNPHVRRVENYIRSNYIHPNRVEQIAGELSLDRRYLSRLFKTETGCSIQDLCIGCTEIGGPIIRVGVRR